MVVCPFCRWSNPEQTSVCLHCGAVLPSAVPPPYAAPPPPASYPAGSAVLSGAVSTLCSGRRIWRLRLSGEPAAVCRAAGVVDYQYRLRLYAVGCCCPGDDHPGPKRRLGVAGKAAAARGHGPEHHWLLSASGFTYTVLCDYHRQFGCVLTIAFSLKKAMDPNKWILQL